MFYCVRSESWECQKAKKWVAKHDHTNRSRWSDEWWWYWRESMSFLFWFEKSLLITHSLTTTKPHPSLSPSLPTIMDFIFRAATIHPSNHFPSLQASRLHSGTFFHTHFLFLLFTTTFFSLFLLYMLFFLLVWKWSPKGTFFPWWVQVREKKERERERGHLGCFRIALNFRWTELKAHVR